MKEMVIATKNKGKVKEFEALFERYGIKITSLLDINEPIPDIEETGTTFKENARLKAEGIAKVLNVPVVADDSGLAVDALEGRPGVYSARYAGEPTDDMKNYEKLLDELKDVPDMKEQLDSFVYLLLPSLVKKRSLQKELVKVQ